MTAIRRAASGAAKTQHEFPPERAMIATWPGQGAWGRFAR